MKYVRKNSFLVNTCIVFFGMSLILFSLQSQAQVYPLEIFKSGELKQRALATQINKNQLLVSYQVTLLGDQFNVQTNTNASLPTTIVTSSEKYGLALLQLTSLPTPSRSLASAGITLNRKVFLMDSNQQSTESVLLNEQLETSDKKIIKSHSGLVSINHLSQPVFNDCQQVAGISVHKRRYWLGDTLKADVGTGRFIDIDTVKAFLKANKIEFTVAEEICQAPEVKVKQLVIINEDLKKRTREEISQLENDKQQANEELKQLNTAIEQLESDTNADKAELEALLERAQQMEQQSLLREQEIEQNKQELLDTSEKLAELEEKNLEIIKQNEKLTNDLGQLAKHSEESRKKLVLIAIAALLILSLLYLILMRRKKASIKLAKEQLKAAEEQVEYQAENLQELNQKVSEELRQFSDILLVGQTETGEKIQLRINGNALIRSKEGQFIGRQANISQHVISHEKIGRQHARLFIENDTLFIQDLDSTNGTEVNGTAIIDSESAKLVHGAQLKLGTVLMQVYIIKDK